MNTNDVGKKREREEKEKPYDDLPDPWFKRKEISLIEVQDFKTVQPRKQWTFCREGLGARN